MKRYVGLLIMITFSFLLMSCAATNRTATLKQDKTVENWQAAVVSDARPWVRGADRWFMTGRANATELQNRRAPYANATSTLSVRVPSFNKIKVNGDFQVQLYGTSKGHNTVHVYGPNLGVRQVIVEVQGDTLCVLQAPNAPRLMQKVIIRIGIRDLRLLVQEGCGIIEGVNIHSGCLDLIASKTSKGNIYLSGTMNVKSVVHSGSGSINVFGAVTPYLTIRTNGRGSVNLSGNVGVSSIIHHGTADINIIGVNSDSLRILADGSGKISLNGPVCIKEIRAFGCVCVFANNVSSDAALYVLLNNNARVGLAGRVGSLYVDASNTSSFMGRYLCATEAFVRAHDAAHVNVTAGNKIFASATQFGSIYFYGSPNVLSQFVSGNGVVMPIWGMGYVSCPVPPRVYNLNVASAPEKHSSQKVRVFPYRQGEG